MYRLGDFLLDPEKAVLRRNEQIIHLPRKPYSLFVHLVENRHRLVPREELLDRFWNGQEVYDQNLSKAVGNIRKALGEPRDGGLYLETRWGTGYRYIGPFEEVASRTYAAEPANPIHFEPIGSFPESSEATLPTTVAAGPKDSSKRMTIRWPWLAATALVLAVAAGFSIRSQPGSKSAGSKSGIFSAAEVTKVVHVRRSIAILGFDNLSERRDSAWLSGALSEMFATEFDTAGQLRTIPEENVSQARAELKLATVHGLSWGSLAALHANLAADWVVTGGYTVLSPSHTSRPAQIRIDIRVQDAVSSETIASIAETGTVDHLFTLIQRANADLSEKLGLAPASEAQDGMTQAAVPSTPEALRSYSDGVSKLRAMEFQNAIDSLHRAGAQDPSFPLTHLALSKAWSALGYEEASQSEAKQAWQLSSHLSRANQLQVQGRYEQTIHAWDKAVNSYRSLYTFYPDNIEYGLMLADAQTSSGHANDALETVGSMRRLPTPASDDPRLDLTESYADQSLSNSSEALKFSGRAAERARLHGNRLMYARALSMQAGQLGASDVPRSIELSQQARAICEEFNDLNCVAAIHRRIAVFKVDSEPAVAESESQKGLEIARHIGNKDEEEKDLSILAALLANQGRYGEADQLFGELLGKSRASNSKWGIQENLNNLGGDLIEEGKVPQARKTEEEALAIAQEIGLKSGSIYELLDLGHIQELEGDLSGAQARYQQALDLSRQIGFTAGSALSIGGLGNILRTRGDLAGAQIKHEESLRLLLQGGDGSAVASQRLALARLALDQNRADDAEHLARESIDTFTKLNSPDNEARAHALMAEALVERHKFEEGEREIAHSLSLISASRSTLAVLEVGLSAARVQASLPANQNSARLNRIADQLQTIAVQARTHQILNLELEAVLTKRIIGFRSNHVSSSKEHLLAFEKDARTRGYFLMARIAVAAAS
jgi:DNA-binding winged helix-turn-helix (wHTH) protein/tetratricopeptide (TPR) repeat protein